MEYKIIEINDITYVEQIKDLFKDLYWANNRNLEEIEYQIRHSTLSIGIIEIKTNKLVGFARVLSDLKFIATIFDVVIKKDYQKKGLGKKLITAILEHPMLKEVQQKELYCKSENIAFYEQFGFYKLDDLNFMRLKK